ncbi:hypothetical protein Btru_026293 [Bulinus truncatus]|nr:hypothetical protein Btru_026293 [Bulinus truncatus]
MRNLSAMDVVKVAKDYFVSSQNALLIPSRDYGSRKFLHVGRSRLPWGLPRSVSLPSGVGFIAGLKAEVSKRPTVQGRSWRKQGAATTMRSGLKGGVTHPSGRVFFFFLRLLSRGTQLCVISTRRRRVVKLVELVHFCLFS